MLSEKANASQATSRLVEPNELGLHTVKATTASGARFVVGVPH